MRKPPADDLVPQVGIAHTSWMLTVTYRASEVEVRTWTATGTTAEAASASILEQISGELHGLRAVQDRVGEALR